MNEILFELSTFFFDKFWIIHLEVPTCNFYNLRILKLVMCDSCYYCVRKKSC